MTVLRVGQRIKITATIGEVDGDSVYVAFDGQSSRGGRYGLDRSVVAAAELPPDPAPDLSDVVALVDGQGDPWTRDGEHWCLPGDRQRYGVREAVCFYGKPRAAVRRDGTVLTPEELDGLHRYYSTERDGR